MKNKGVWLGLFMYYSVAFAATQNQNVQDQVRWRTQLVEDLMNEKLSLEEIEQRKRQLLSSLYGLNVQMKRVNKEKARLMDEMFMAENKMQRLNRMIESLEQQIEIQRKKLLVQLRTLAQIKDQGALRLLFSNQNADELSRNIKFLGILINQSYRGIKDYQRLVMAHHQQKKSLSLVVSKLNLLKESIKKKEKFILARQSEKREILTKIEKKRQLQLSTIGNLRKQTLLVMGIRKKINRVDEELTQLLQTSFFEYRGNLHPPVNGTVAQDFGLIKDETFNVALASKGIFFQTASNEKVKSVFSGVVEFVGKIKNFGETIILNHGDHYYTVYGNLKEVEVIPGDHVDAQQILASVGSPSFERPAGMYFEIRHFSEPENPNFWLRTHSKEEIP